MMESIRDHIRTFFCGNTKPPTKIQETLAGIETIFERAMRHSHAYQNVIGLLGDSRIGWYYTPGANPIMALSIMDEDFRLETTNICCAHYRCAESWQTIIQTRAMTNKSLNMTVGRGTAEFNIVPDEWHERIIAVLTVGRLDDVGYEFHYEGETLLITPQAATETLIPKSEVIAKLRALDKKLSDEAMEPSIRGTCYGFVSGEHRSEHFAQGD